MTNTRIDHVEEKANLRNLLPVKRMVIINLFHLLPYQY